jgi:DNA repair protein RadD
VFSTGSSPPVFRSIRLRSCRSDPFKPLAKRYERYREPKLIIWDEAHHLAAGSWSKVFDAFPSAYHIGLTATPERLDGTGLGKWFQEMIHGPSVRELIDQKYLAPYKIFAPSSINLENVHTRMGDFVKSELNSILDKPTITGDVIREYQKRAAGKRAVVFAVSIEHSKHVVAQFESAGISAAHVDGDTDSDVRDQTLRRFEAGEIQVVSNCDLFGEGLDIPGIECAILLRPTQSLSLYLQQVGRALRPAEGKDFAVILDHAGNCQRHGLPDEDREWSLEGRRGTNRKKLKHETSSVKVCPKCFAAQFSENKSCFNCALVFELKPRSIETVDGDLQEVDPAQMKRKRFSEQAQAESMEDLVALGRQRKYKNPSGWAKYIFEARKKRNLGRDVQ